METIKQQVSEFLQQSNRLPLLKNLPTDTNAFRKIKVRQRKNQSPFRKVLNEAVGHPKFCERSIFANGVLSFEESSAAIKEPYYILPINGFKFMYSSEVKQSKVDHERLLKVVFREFGEEQAHEITKDLLRFTYTNECLSEGISCGAEIIIYNIPYFFACQVSAVDTYEHLLTLLEEQ